VLGTAALVAGGSAVSSSFPPQAASVARTRTIVAARRDEWVEMGVNFVLTGGLHRVWCDRLIRTPESADQLVTTVWAERPAERNVAGVTSVRVS
jgi:hypothetical protein